MSPSLSLQIHSRYGRTEVFSSVGVKYTAQNRSLNTGLSPECPDGGFFIFITLNKEDFGDPRHNYDDQLFENEFIWVTRRGRSADNRDYVKIRRADTRVSLFVRLRRRDKFVYAGELEYGTHREFTDAETGEVQQSYTWKLKTPLPEALLPDLTLTPAETGHASPRARPTAERGRRPSNFDDFKRMLSYALGSLERRVVPGHHNYQVRLKRFMAERGVVPEFEKDFVDVNFVLEGKRFIGEIKVTGFLSLNQAFRIALGQLLEYKHLRFDSIPQMVMFFDSEPDTSRVELATRFSIAVVVEDGDRYRLLNSDVAPELRVLFVGRAHK